MQVKRLECSKMPEAPKVEESAFSSPGFASDSGRFHADQASGAEGTTI